MIRSSARSNKGQPPSYLKDYVVEATSNSNQLNKNASEDNNFNENTVIDNSGSENSNMGSQEEILSAFERLTHQLNEMQTQREADIKVRDEFQNDVMNRINQLSIIQTNAIENQPTQPQQNTENQTASNLLSPTDSFKSAVLEDDITASSSAPDFTPISTVPSTFSTTTSAKNLRSIYSPNIIGNRSSHTPYRMPQYIPFLTHAPLQMTRFIQPGPDSNQFYDSGFYPQNMIPSSCPQQFLPTDHAPQPSRHMQDDDNISNALKFNNPSRDANYSYNSVNVPPNPVNYERHRKLHDLPEFHGKPEQWPMFISSYRDSTHAFGYSNLENNLRIQKSVKGDAMKAIESLLIFPENIENAITQLEFLYGRPECLIRSQITEVRRIAAIDENHLEQLIPFATKIRNLSTFLETTNSQQHLANPMLIEELVNKLPMNKRMDWAQFSMNIKPYATVKDFSTWVDQIARLVSKIISTTTPLTSQFDKRTNSKKNTVLHASSSSFGEASQKPETTSSTTSAISCSICGASHKTTECEKFINSNVNDRWTQVKGKRLCFTCLRKGHSTFSCRFKKHCGVDNCRRYHHKLLHEAKIEVTPPITPNSSNPPADQRSCLSCQSNGIENQPPQILFKVVPVKLYGANKVITSHALLDEGSEVSMIDQELANQLGLKENSTQPLHLKWFGNITSKYESKSINIDVCGVSKGCKKFQLTNLHTVKDLELPIQSLCLEKLHSKFHHLRGLPIVDYSNVRPKILIGIDNGYVGLAKLTRYGKPDEPICIKTKLGVIVYGPTQSQSTLPKNVLFIENDSKNYEPQIDDIVKDYFTTENFGVKAPVAIIESKSDERARQILEETTKRIGNRFETGLLWCKDDVQLPDSRPMAERRLYGIEKKMVNDPEFAHDYKSNMNKYIQNKYARKLTDEEAKIRTSRTWYLPHFGVRNPNKPQSYEQFLMLLQPLMGFR